jgi:MGT family glycosyltransferase
VRSARILFVVPPLVGHTVPTVALASALQARGHQVAWCAHPSAVRSWLPEGATTLPLDEGRAADIFRSATAQSAELRGAGAFRMLWEDFLIPLARITLPELEDAIRGWQPDLLIVDQQTLAGGLAARRLGLPWATLVSTSASVSGELDELPKVRAWRDGLLASLQEEVGLPVVQTPDLSPQLVLVLSTRALVGQVDLPVNSQLVGPMLGGARPTVPFPWEALDDRPKLLVTLGTVNAQRGARFYETVREAFPDPAMQILIAAPEALTGPLPAHFLRQDRLPLVELLPRVDVVLCHGGHNTVCEALAHGVPLVIAPIKDDQPIVARQVTEAGAGLRVRFGRVGAERLRAAVEEVMTAPAYAEAACRIGRSFEEAGGAVRAAALVEEVVRG